MEKSTADRFEENQQLIEQINVFKTNIKTTVEAAQESNLDEMKNALEKLGKDLDSLRKDLEDQTGGLRNENVNINALLSDVPNKMAEIEQKFFVQVNNVHEKSSGDLNLRITEILGNMETFQTDLEAKIKEVDDDNKAQNGKIQENRDNISNLKSNIDISLQDLDDRQAVTINNLKINISELSADNEKLGELLESLQEQTQG